MKYYKTLNLYKASNVTFNPETYEAISYGWWIFVKEIGNKIVFNDHNYSNSTSKHQYKIRALLNELNIQIDLFITSPRGLDDLDSAINYYKTEIDRLESEMKVKGSHAKKNEERVLAIKRIKAKIKQVEALKLKV